MGPDLYEQGYERITNVDCSAACIESQAARWARLEHMDWSALDLADGRDDAEVADVAAGSFQAILDKAVLDALLTAPDRGVAARQYLRHAHRLLLPRSGPMVIISHGNPEQRLPLLLAEGVSGRDASATDRVVPETIEAKLQEATDAVAAALTAADSPEAAVKSLTSSPVIELTEGTGRWSAIRVFVLPKPPVTVQAGGVPPAPTSRAADGHAEDDDSTTSSDEDNEDVVAATTSSASTAPAGSVWAVVATAAHFAYMCYA